MSAMVSSVMAYHFIKLLLLSFQIWCIWNSHTNFTPRFTFSKINMQFRQDFLTCVVYLARCTCSDYAAFDGLATICLSNIHYQRLHKGKMWHRPLNDHPLGASACVLGKLVVSKYIHIITLDTMWNMRGLWNAKLTYIQIFIPIFKYLDLGTNHLYLSSNHLYLASNHLYLGTNDLKIGINDLYLGPNDLYLSSNATICT